MKHLLNTYVKSTTCKVFDSDVLLATLIKDEKKTYCLACRKYTKNINPKIVRTNCAICGSKKSRFIKEHLAMGLLSNLGIGTPLSQVPLLNVLF